ncbi:MAG: hypothetical protein R6U50_13670 [Desulfobacterales bacterium]
MLYVERDRDGKIISLHKQPKPGVDEQKTVMDDEVLAFIENTTNSDAYMQLLSLSDSGAVRIIEDLIDLLVRKNIIHFMELPKVAREKIIERRHIREKLSTQNIVVDDIL